MMTADELGEFSPQFFEGVTELWKKLEIPKNYFVLHTFISGILTACLVFNARKNPNITSRLEIGELNEVIFQRGNATLTVFTIQNDGLEDKQSIMDRTDMLEFTRDLKLKYEIRKNTKFGNGIRTKRLNFASPKDLKLISINESNITDFATEIKIISRLYEKLYRRNGLLSKENFLVFAASFALAFGYQNIKTTNFPSDVSINGSTISGIMKPLPRSEWQELVSKRSNPLLLNRIKRQAGLKCTKMIPREYSEDEEPLIESEYSKRYVKSRWHQKVIKQIKSGYRIMELSVKDYAIQHPNALENIETMGKTGGALMMFQMSIDLIGGILDKNPTRVVVGSMWLGGPIVLGKVAEMLTTYVLPVFENMRALATLCRLTSSLLGRVPGVFIIVGLWHSVQDYRAGHADSLVPLVGNSAAAGLEVVGIGIEVAAAFEVALCVDLVAMGVLGPFALVAAAIFIAMAVWNAVSRVKQLNSVIQLTAKEKFWETLRAVFSLSSQSYVEWQAERKRIHGDLISQMNTYLTNRTDVELFVEPNMFVSHYLTTKTTYITYSVVGYASYPMESSKFTEVAQYKSFENNFVDFQSAKSVRYSRTFPDIDGKTQELVCSEFDVARNEDLPSKSVELYECIGMVGLRLKEREGIAHIDIGNGSDVLRGFLDKPNEVWLHGSGNKYVSGGNADDTFVIKSISGMYGLIDGRKGLDTLIVMDDTFVNKTVSIQTDSANISIIKTSEKRRLVIKNVEKFVGRSELPDEVSISCNTALVNMAGSSDELMPDKVFVNEMAKCDYNTQIVINKNTHVVNMATQGTFSYIIQQISGVALIDLKKNTLGHHVFHFLNEIESLEKVSIDTKNGNLNVYINDTKHTVTNQLTVKNYHHQYPIAFLSQTALVMNGKDMIVHMTNETSVNQVLERSKKLEHLHATVFALVNSQKQEVHVGHNELNESKPFLNMLTNNPSVESFLFGAKDNVYNISLRCTQNTLRPCDFKPVTIVIEQNGTNLIDLQNLRRVAKVSGIFKKIVMTPGEAVQNGEFSLEISGYSSYNDSSSPIVLGTIRVQVKTKGALVQARLEHTLNLNSNQEGIKVISEKPWIEFGHQVTVMLDRAEVTEKQGLRRPNRQRLGAIFISCFSSNSLVIHLCDNNDCDLLTLKNYFDDPTVYDSFELVYGSEKSTIGKEYRKWKLTNSPNLFCES